MHTHVLERGVNKRVGQLKKAGPSTDRVHQCTLMPANFVWDGERQANNALGRTMGKLVDNKVPDKSNMLIYTVFIGISCILLSSLPYQLHVRSIFFLHSSKNPGEI